MSMLNTEFVENVRELVGLPYAECDCKDVICKALGIRMSGTNWLWRSIGNSSKYRYLIYREEIPPLTDSLLIGDILFKIRSGCPDGYSEQPDAYHVGVYIGDGCVIHSSPKTGVRVDGYRLGEWQGLGRMKQVEYVAEMPDQTAQNKTELTDHEMITAIYYKLIGGID